MTKKDTQLDDGWNHIGDKVQSRKLVKAAKFNWLYVDLAARYTAAGYDVKDLAFLLGVEPATVGTWRKRYPQFRKALEQGRDIAVSHLVAKGIRAAGGYDYTEVKQEFTFNKDGEKKMTKEVIQKKHKDPNAALLTFFLMNMAPKHFKELKKVEIETKHKLDVTLKESDAIRKLVGALADSPEKIIDAEFEPVVKEVKDILEIS